MTLLGVAIAGALGAAARFLIERAIARRATTGFPLGTFLVNVSGSLALGFLTGLVLYHGLGSVPKTVLGTGFLGAYTTFSTYTYETVRRAEQSEVGIAAVYAIASLIIGVGAAALGLVLASI